MRRSWILAALLLAPAAWSQSVQLAPAPGAEPDEVEAPPEALADARWSLCEITASLLATAPGRSIVAAETKELVYLGESVDLGGDITIPLKQGTALVNARVRLRAAMASDTGVSYLISSAGILRSTVGFLHEQAGRDQFRNEVLAVTDSGARLHEVFALPDLELRVLLVISVRRVQGRDEPSAWDLARPPAETQLRRIRVEALMRDGDTLQPLEQAVLQTLDGREAGMALTQMSRAPEGPGLGIAPSTSVRLITKPGVKTTTAEEMGALRGVPGDDRFQRRVEDLQRSMHIDPTVSPNRKLPGQMDLPGTPRKISKKKKAKIQEQQKQQAQRKWAIEQARTVAGSAAVPEGFRREGLDVTVIPLHATRASLQIEIRLRGRVRLPGEKDLTEINTSVIEQVPFGETLEIGVAELVRDERPRYDFMLRITPEP